MPMATVVGSDMTAEQSAAMMTPFSNVPGVSAEAGAKGGTESAVSSEQEATRLDSPSGMSVESDDEPFSASAKAGTSV